MPARQLCPAAVLAAPGGGSRDLERARSIGALWAARPEDAAMRMLRWWRIPACVPRRLAIEAERLGHEIGVTLVEMPVLALTLAEWSDVAIAQHLGRAPSTVVSTRNRIAGRANQ